MVGIGHVRYRNLAVEGAVSDQMYCPLAQLPDQYPRYGVRHDLSRTDNGSAAEYA